VCGLCAAGGFGTVCLRRPRQTGDPCQGPSTTRGYRLLHRDIGQRSRCCVERRHPRQPVCRAPRTQVVPVVRTPKVLARTKYEPSPLPSRAAVLDLHHPDIRMPATPGGVERNIGHIIGLRAKCQYQRRPARGACRTDSSRAPGASPTTAAQRPARGPSVAERAQLALTSGWFWTLWTPPKAASFRPLPRPRPGPSWASHNNASAVQRDIDGIPPRSRLWHADRPAATASSPRVSSSEVLSRARDGRPAAWQTLGREVSGRRRRI